MKILREEENERKAIYFSESNSFWIATLLLAQKLAMTDLRLQERARKKGSKTYRGSILDEFFRL